MFLHYVWEKQLASDGTLLLTVDIHTIVCVLGMHLTSEPNSYRLQSVYVIVHTNVLYLVMLSGVYWMQ